MKGKTKKCSRGIHVFSFHESYFKTTLKCFICTRATSVYVAQSQMSPEESNGDSCIKIKYTNHCTSEAQNEEIHIKIYEQRL